LRRFFSQEQTSGRSHLADPPIRTARTPADPWLAFFLLSLIAETNVELAHELKIKIGSETRSMTAQVRLLGKAAAYRALDRVLREAT